MMTRLFLVLTMGLVLAGCAGPGPAGPLVCEEIEQKPCKGNKNSPFVEVKTKWYSSKKLHFKPECVNAAPGTSVVFNIKLKKVKLNEAELSPEKSANGWLNGRNKKNASYIVIDIPEGTPDDEYKYNFKTTELCADPRVHVKD